METAATTVAELGAAKVEEVTEAEERLSAVTSHAIWPLRVLPGPMFDRLLVFPGAGGGAAADGRATAA